MDAELQRYLKLLAEGKAEELSSGELAALRERYPFFVQPDMTLLNNAARLSEEEMRMLREDLSLSSGDIAAVGEMLEAEGHAAPFYPPDKPQERMTTDSAIDTFLDRYGSGHSDTHETELLEKLIFNPVAPDYTSELEAMADHDTATPTAATDRDRLIDAFIARNSDDAIAPTPADDIPIEPPAAAEPPEPPVRQSDSRQPDNHALLSESLAKIYIRRGRYEKAFEIIHSLSLNYPEKSVYFADQLRFLHKAMLIKQRQAARKNK